MTLNELLCTEELTEDFLRDLVFECSKYNDDLKNFISSKSWKSLPTQTLQDIIRIYNDSQVNLKTGKIVIEAKRMKMLKIFNTLHFKYNYKADKPVECIMFLVFKNKDGKVKHISDNQNPIEYCTEFETGINEETVIVNFNNVPDDTDKIFVIVSTVEDFKDFKEYNFIAQDPVGKVPLQEISLKDKMNQNRSIICLEIVRDRRNDWGIYPRLQASEFNAEELKES